MSASGRCSLALVCGAALVVAACAPSASQPRRSAMRLEAIAVEAMVGSRDGAKIWYRADGQGEPTLLLVHGWTADASSWQTVVDAFRGGHRVVTLDLAGHGRSEGPRVDWSVEGFADDVAAVARALELGPTVLVGHSLGAQVAVAAAPLLGDRVRAVVVVDSLHDLTQTPADAEREAFLAPFRADYAGEADRFARRLFPAGSDPRLVDATAAQMAAAPPQPAVAMLESVWRFDAAAAVRRLTVPLVAINSDQHPTNVEGNRQVHADFDAVVMRGVGHFPHLERPADFVIHLAAVVARAAPPPPPAPVRPR